MRAEGERRYSKHATIGYGPAIWTTRASMRARTAPQMFGIESGFK